MESSTTLSFDKFLPVWRNGTGKKGNIDWSKPEREDEDPEDDIELD